MGGRETGWPGRRSGGKTRGSTKTPSSVTSTPTSTAHDAVCAAWRGLDRLRDPAALEAWFTRILVNACRDHLRRRRVRPLAVELPDAIPGPEGSGDPAALDELERALEELSPEHRTVIVLRFWADLSLEEIAERTGERPGTVKSRLHYALAHLRTAYAAEALAGGTRR